MADLAQPCRELTERPVGPSKLGGLILLGSNKLSLKGSTHECVPGKVPFSAALDSDSLCGRREAGLPADKGVHPAFLC